MSTTKRGSGPAGPGRDRPAETLGDECAQLQREVKAALTPLRPTRLLAICGVGALTAAKLLGETHSVDRFASAAAFAAHTGTAPIPVSSGNTQRHRLSRSGNRQLNRALFTIAMCQARWDPNARAYLARKHRSQEPHRGAPVPETTPGQRRLPRHGRRRTSPPRHPTSNGLT